MLGPIIPVGVAASPIAAATKIQSVYRGSKGRAAAEAEKAAKKEAVTKIQAVVRGNQVRKKAAGETE